MRTLACAVLMVALFSSVALAVEPKVATTPSQIVPAGNKFCPVSGDKVSKKDFMDYNGKRYKLCCPMCAGKFKKNPTMYLAKMAAQEANPESTVQEHHDHMGM